MVIKSISYNQEEIIEDIINLHVPQGYIDLDPTYSKGNFYKSGRIQEPTLKYDISPQADDIKYQNCTKLPQGNNRLQCIMFDPPFLAATGKSLKTDKGNITARRFGIYENELKLHKFYKDSMMEFYRVLNKNGVLIFKCQDKVSSGKNYFTHSIIMMQALGIGFYPKDLFVLLTKNRIISGKHKNQIHTRKFHSYFWVFEKKNSKINYKEFI